MGRCSMSVAISATILSLFAICVCGQDPVLAPSPAVGGSIPVVNIPARVDLPTLPVLRDYVNLTMAPARITGPGENNTANGDPYVMYTGRVLNAQLVAGVVRVEQGSSLRVRVCNDLPASVQTINSSIDFGVSAYPLTGGQSFKDPNILAHHLHGHYGNPGTDNVPCDPPPPEGTSCYRGDNIFADINPGHCNEYQYDISLFNAPGTFWMHPHHHGSGALQTQEASLPVLIDQSPAGFDFLDTPTCQPFQRLFTPDNEVIMHMQTFLMAVYENDTDLADPSPGPTDDGYIAVAVKSVPQDPLCCSGPDKEEDGAGLWTVGGENATGFDWDPTITEEPFYVSGNNSQFTLINGAYSPVIRMTAGQVYRWRMVQASTMKWMDLSLNASGCTWGIYARDGIFLRDFPRITDHIVMGAANRVDVMVVCEPGVYSLRTGLGPLEVDPDCGSSHCELLTQDNLATLVVSAQGGYAINASAPFGADSCQPQFPPYLADLRNTPASTDGVTAITYSGLVNFTNGAPGTPASGNCLINSLIYDESAPLQETIGEVTQLDVDNVDQHPYHHHTQPYQIVALANDTDALNHLWRVGDYVDTLLMPSSGMKSATVRWIPGPVEITGTGYALLHCHIMPHSDEGCIMKTQIVQKTYVPVQMGLSNGARAGVTLAILAGLALIIALPIALLKRRSRRRRAAEEHESRAKLMQPPRSSSDGIDANLVANRC